ncbi:MAG: hypothetical protein DRN83_03730 [Hadesarchaea archaeon]|nr:MAG: hypothetical protein DRN83_03730 [Hadesarchaea archaeon]
MFLDIQAELKDRFLGLQAIMKHVEDVSVEKKKAELELSKRETVEEVRRIYTLETLRDVPIFRAYRDFFWHIGIDPTKNRPAAEALIRRVLSGKPLPTINTLVDAYNLASIKTCISVGAFDADVLKGGLVLRKAKSGEEFRGIGMEKPMRLKGNEIVISDEEKLIAVYPYRDADETKITLNTKNVLLLVCGVPGINEDVLKNAGRIVVDHVTKFCGGRETQNGENQGHPL